MQSVLYTLFYWVHHIAVHCIWEQLNVQWSIIQYPSTNMLTRLNRSMKQQIPGAMSRLLRFVHFWPTNSLQYTVAQHWGLHAHSTYVQVQQVLEMMMEGFASKAIDVCVSRLYCFTRACTIQLTMAWCAETPRALWLLVGWQALQLKFPQISM